MLLLLWLGVIFLINPQGDFPLNDDWAYAQNVRTFLDTGQLIFNDWLAMTLVVQVLWGTLWCVVFGFSHEVLRWSTLFLAAIAVGATYQTVREQSGRWSTAWGAALLLLANPWFVHLSFTFMTDVPFLAFFLLSLLFYLRALRWGKTGPVVWGTLFAVLATLIRQYGLLLPLGFGWAWWWRYRRWPALFTALLPLTVTWAALWGFTQWMEAAQGLPESWGRASLLWDRLWSTNLLRAFYERGGVIFWYWGIMLGPFLFLSSPLLKGLRKNRIVSGLAALLLVAVLAIPAWPKLPWGNMLYDFGLGPQTLKDTYYGANVAPRLSGWAWSLLKVAGFVGAAGLLWTSRQRWRSVKPRSTLRRMALLMLAVYTVYLLVDYYLWDRYLLIGLPLWLILLMPESGAAISQRYRWGSIAGLLLLGLFSVVATHDYLAWNRARWEAVWQLEARGIKASRIDGGFEYNAERQPGPRREVSRNGKSWWFVADDEYVVAHSPLPCYEPIDFFFYDRWLPPSRDSILVLQRSIFLRRDTFICDAEMLTADSTALAGGGLRFDNADRRDTTHAWSGRYALRLERASPYGFTARLQDIHPCDRVEVSVWRYTQSRRGGIVFSAPAAGDFYEFTGHVVEQNANGWQKLLHEITVPKGYPDNSLVVYIWHLDDVPGWYDEMKIVRSDTE